MLPAFLFVLALALRVTWILAVPSKPVGDFAMYLEAATHWLEHGRFDAQFIYMPGYVLLAAAVQRLGGAWLATKLLVAVMAAAGAPMLYGITWRLWGSATDKRSAAWAGVLYAMWPGGVAVSSVTGTDIPAAMLVLAGAYALVRSEPSRPHPGAALAGMFFGLSAWVRAVALPLVPLAAPFLWVRTRNVKRAALATLFATLAAAFILAPWVVRNRLRYGEWFLSDSHGGLTALVGAYPNADGQFTRALNRTYEIVNARPWLSEPHRAADKGAYAEAKRWTRFEPAFALGLGLARVDKLLSNERSLLYWPLYRAGVLKNPPSGFFDKWRPEIEWATDLVWWLVLWGCLFSVPWAVCTRRWQALAFVPMQAALVGVYVLYFAESRYHLAIAALAFPGAAASVVAVMDAVRGARKKTALTNVYKPLVASGAFVCAIAVLWLALSHTSAALIEQHRWAVHACHIEGRPQFCLWKRANDEGASPVKGVFDGVGLVPSQPSAVAVMDIDLQPTRHLISGRLQLHWSGARPAAAPTGKAGLRINSQQVLEIPLSTLWAQSGWVFNEPFVATHGRNVVELSIEGVGTTGAASRPRLWLLDLSLPSDPRAVPGS